ncbi:RrF2 family transcriptional regulator [Kurthia sibirica]|uniref:Transcriptional regulator n=1 Tax=Kurthia sibirica TaxID=202750 RepID=A0A2U3ANJ2_9BACL|nr:Rrf2 family transcriptional regulator [Kurthia sibirica]PWI26104.1 transcriptional regulator [Kurthia sibirica]GEK34942.1 hypothetical protein KSI01_24750 [Kurthia sibirica]
MAQIKRFGYGLQAMLVMTSHNKLHSSSEIAKLIQYEKTQLRKILSLLVEAQLVSVQQGRGGGYYMTKNSKDISLFAIYNAVNPGQQPEWHRLLATTGENYFGQQVNESFEEITSELSLAIKAILTKYTLHDLLQDRSLINM